LLKSLKNSRQYLNFLSIFSEFIQNAEDAGATEIKFILDRRELNKERTFGKSFNSLQGPALLSWNNAVFSEAELTAIKSLGKGNKSLDTSKIGRFGVGFNAVYHLTDAPQFLSDFENYAIFDPMCAHFPDLDMSDPGYLIRNAEKKLKNSIFSDVLSGFELNGVGLKKSTLFRLPLRKSKSNISDSVDADQVKELMNEFIITSKHVLLFLKSVTKIGFYEYNNINGLTMIDEISTEISADDKNLRYNHLKAIKNSAQKSFDAIAKSSLQYQISINSFIKRTKSCYLIFEQFGFDKKLMKQEEIARLGAMAKDKEQKYTPVGSIGIELGTPLTHGNFKLFNYLPLEQPSPFLFHINGYFALKHENRTHIYDYGLRSEGMNQLLANWCTDWNLYLINFIILPLYLQFMEHLKATANEADFIIENYLRMLPRSVSDEPIRPYFTPMLRMFFNGFF
jgi:sacsin